MFDGFYSIPWWFFFIAFLVVIACVIWPKFIIAIIIAMFVFAAWIKIT